jgi:hypothetical protein
MHRRYQSSQTGSSTKKFSPTIESRVKADKYYRPNYYTIQFITNHGNFGQYLARFEIKTSQMCERCLGQIDHSEHRIYKCGQYIIQRNESKASVESDWSARAHALIEKNNLQASEKFCDQTLDTSQEVQNYFNNIF